MSLTGKQRAFVNHYLQSWNASEAARQAGYSEKTAGSIGSENLQKPEIKAEIERRLITQHAPSQDEIIFWLSEIVRASIADFATVDGGIVSVDPLAVKQRGHLIKSMRQTKYGVEIEMYDRLTALDKLARAQGMYSEVEDWRTTVIQYIQIGNVTFEMVADELGENLAEELFRQAGIPCHASRDDSPLPADSAP